MPKHYLSQNVKKAIIAHCRNGMNYQKFFGHFGHEAAIEIIKIYLHLFTFIMGLFYQNFQKVFSIQPSWEAKHESTNVNKTPFWPQNVPDHVHKMWNCGGWTHAIWKCSRPWCFTLKEQVSLDIFDNFSLSLKASESKNVACLWQECWQEVWGCGGGQGWLYWQQIIFFWILNT